MSTGDDTSDETPAENGPAALLSAYPQLFTTDMARSCAFFAQKFGFFISSLQGDPPFYCQATRDDIRLELRRIDNIAFDERARARQALLAAHIETDAVRELHAEFSGRGVTSMSPINDRLGEPRSFFIADPDGNTLLFSER